MKSSWPSNDLVDFAAYRGGLLKWDRSGRRLVDLAYLVGADELVRLSASLRGTPIRKMPRPILKRSFGEGREIEIGVLGRIETNGYARFGRSRSGRHISTLSLGFLTVMAGIIINLWQNSNFMPWIRSDASDPQIKSDKAYVIEWLQLAMHEISDERRDALAIRARRVTIEDLLDGNVQCRRRQAGAIMMFTDCVRFAWLHELGHILLGHTSIAPVQEAPDGLWDDSPMSFFRSVAPTGSDYQIIELQADDFAGRMLIEEKMFCIDRSFELVSNLLLTAAISATLFGVLYHALNVLDNPQTTLAYPPTWVRAQATFDLMRIACERVGQSSAIKERTLRRFKSRYLSSIQSTSQISFLFGELLDPILNGNYEGMAAGYIADLVETTRSSPYIRALRPWYERS